MSLGSRASAAVGAGRRAVAALGGRIPSALIAIAFLVIAVMYCRNDNYDKDPSAPRGDGVYRPVLARGDGHMHYLVTRSIVFDRDFHFDNDLKRFGDPWNQPRTVTGRKNVMQQIGPSLIWAPVLAAAHGGALLANAVGADIQTHGYTMFHQRIVFSTSVLFAWLSIVLGVLLARRLLGGRWGPALAGIGALLGTSLTYYATYMPAYAHAMDSAACTSFLALWAFTIGDLRWRRFVFLGLLLGTAAMVRAQDILMGAVVALEVLVLAARGQGLGGLVLRGGVTLAISVLLYVPQLYVWNEFYGSWFTTPQGPGQMRYAHPMVLELLFSARNGWLSTTPLCYFAMIGLGVGIWRGPRLGPHVRIVCIGMVLAVVGQVYVNAVTYEWWSGASYGQRRLCSVTLAVIVGLAVLFRALHLVVARRWQTERAAWIQRGLAAAVLAWFVTWNLVWVGKLDHGASAGRDNRPTCCDDAPKPLRWLARPIYNLVGNPFQFPANALFAIEHGVGLQRWDHAVGMYPLVPGVLGYEDGSYRRVTAKWDIAGPGGAPYLLDGWAPSQHSNRSSTRVWRWTTATRAELLLPILMPEPHRITMPVAANVAPGQQREIVVYVNGAEVTRATVGAEWSPVTFDTDGSLGTNVIAIEAPVEPFVGASVKGPLAPAAAVPVGVAIGALHVALPPLTAP